MSVTTKGGLPAIVAGGNEPRLPMLLDFHSPTAALTVEPVLYLARPVTWMVATLVGACFAAAALVPIDKVVTAQGRIIALTATSVVQPLETAIVRSVDVREGDRVTKGQVLAQLDPTFATADVGALRSQVASLQAEVNRLGAEADGSQYRPNAGSPVMALQGALFLQHTAERAYKNENYNQKINSLQSQIQRALASDVSGYSRTPQGRQRGRAEASRTRDSYKSAANSIGSRRPIAGLRSSAASTTPRPKRLKHQRDLQALAGRAGRLQPELARPGRPGTNRTGPQAERRAGEPEEGRTAPPTRRTPRQ